MNHLSQVFFYELKRNLRRRGFLFMTFGLPLLVFILLLGYQVISRASEAETPDAAEQDNPFEFESIDHAGYVDYSALFDDPGDLSDVMVRYDDEAAARAALDSGEIDVYYVIAPDYVESGDVTLVLPRMAVNLINTAPVRQLILSRLAEDVDPDLFARLSEPSNASEINLQRDATGQTASNFGSDFLVVYIFAITLMLSVFLTNGYLLQTVIEEKETRLIEILISSMRPTQLLGGKILALGLLGLLQIIVWIGAVLLIGRFFGGEGVVQFAALVGFQLEAGKVILLLLYFIFGYLFFAGAYGMVSAISTSMQEGPQFAVIFTLPAALPLYFVGVFTATPDAGLPVALSIIPFTSPLAMVMRISLTTVPAWQIIVSLALLALTDVLLIWMAGRLFRVQTLLAGQAPKLRDLPRLLRG